MLEPVVQTANETVLLSASSMVAAAWLAGSLLGIALERLAKPGTEQRQRPIGAWLLHLGLWTLLFAGLLLLLQRPWFAAAAGLTTQLVVILVNNAKVRALQEPFLFSDFGLFSQAVRHPRLYLPFLGVGPAMAALISAGIAIYLGMTLEPSLLQDHGVSVFLGIAATAALLGTGLMTIGGRTCPAPALEPRQDLRQLGLAASIWMYWRLERRQREAAPPEGRLPESCRTAVGQRLPDIIAVQSESFCDGRRFWPQGIRQDVLQSWDLAKSGAALHGRLRVPAWGANTMRTEFAFLSGIAPDSLGVHRFNPYRIFARRPIHSLASVLRQLGYRTICIHPHPAGFFARDKVYPQLGFDDFIDISHFQDEEPCGPYICDAAVTRMIREVRASTAGPVFIFAITMENHGPLHLERVTDEDHAALYTAPPPGGFTDLTVYLRHLRNADRMLAELTGDLAQTARPGVICWFGDHVPSMPEVYARTGYTDARTDYLIWPGGDGQQKESELATDALAAELLSRAGLSAKV